MSLAPFRVLRIAAIHKCEDHYRRALMPRLRRAGCRARHHCPYISGRGGVQRRIRTRGRSIHRTARDCHERVAIPLSGRGYGSDVRAGRRTVWSRGERRAAIDALLSAATIEIRYLASRPEDSTHPDGHLTEILFFADVCHRLAGADKPQPAGEYDALVWTWQVANDFQRSWLRTRLGRRTINIGFLEQAPALPRAVGGEVQRRDSAVPRRVDDSQAAPPGRFRSSGAGRGHARARVTLE
jgi:hypothetical protein